MLHAKTFAVDGQRLFVGSFNFDPRSMHLNTELGFVIESPTLAADVSNEFLTDIPANAYEVVLAEDGRLNWLARTPDGVGVHPDEPGAIGWQRAAISLLSRMPIAWWPCMGGVATVGGPRFALVTLLRRDGRHA